jgi:hypothetical protein
MFRSRLEMLSYVIRSITGGSQEDCDKMALQFENKPFVIKISLD